MLSDLRQRKLSALFDCFDFNKADYFEAADYEHFAQNLAKAYTLTPGTTEYAGVYADTMAIWEYVRSVADHDGNGQVSRAEFSDAYGALADNDATFRRVLMGYAEYVIRTSDRDGDGRLNENEYVVMVGCYGVAETAARAAFQHLDQDGSGALSTGEVEKIFEAFFRSDDPEAAGNWLIGPV